MRVKLKLNELKGAEACMFPRIYYLTPFPRIRLFPRIRCTLERLKS